MKRLGILLLVGLLLIVSTVTFAKEPNNDGIITWSGTGADFNIDKTINRNPKVLDSNGSGQLAQVNLKMYAYIPCYLKLELTGNNGKTIVESFGPPDKDKTIGQAISNPVDYCITFDNEMGGFVDQDWKSLGAGRNLEIAPGPDVFIAACDIFHVKVYSNDNFKYDVIAAPLDQNGGSNKLNLEMGTSGTVNGTYSTTVFDAQKTVNIGNGNPCETLQYYHKFRVPYSTTTVHGGYSGTVTFKAYTI